MVVTTTRIPFGTLMQAPSLAPDEVIVFDVAVFEIWVRFQSGDP